MPVRSCCVYWSGNEEMWALYAVPAKVQPNPHYFSYIQSPSTFRWIYVFFFSWTSGWRSAVSRIYVCFIPDEVLAVWWITSSNPLLGFVFGGSMVELHTPVVTCSVPGQLD